MQVFLGTILVYYYNCIPLDIFDKKISISKSIINYFVARPVSQTHAKLLLLVADTSRSLPDMYNYLFLEVHESNSKVLEVMEKAKFILLQKLFEIRA